MELGREAQLGAGRQPHRVADDAGPDLGERRDALVVGARSGRARRGPAGPRAPRPRPSRRPGCRTRRPAAACPALPVDVRRRRRGREHEAQPVLAGAAARPAGSATGSGGARRSGRSGPTGRAVEPHLDRLAPHAACRARRSRIAGARLRRRPRRARPRPRPAPTGTARRPAPPPRGRSLGLLRLGRRRAEEQHLARRPALGDGQARGEVVDDRLRRGRGQPSAPGRGEDRERRRRARRTAST